MGTNAIYKRNNLRVLRNVSSKMAMSQIKSCIRSLHDFTIQTKEDETVSPYWGFFIHIANRLPATYLRRIREVVYLRHFGDVLKPTSIIVKFDPKDYTQINNRWIRAIKIKGITNRIGMVKKGRIAAH